MTRQTLPEAHNPAELSPILSDLWYWFNGLHRARGQGLNGPDKITESEMGWYFHNRGIRPSSWHLDAIRVLDAIALQSLREQE
jgi:hypothetical protein